MTGVFIVGTACMFLSGLALLVYLWAAVSSDRLGSDLMLLIVAYLLTFPVSLALLLGLLGDCLLRTRER